MLNFSCVQQPVGSYFIAAMKIPASEVCVMLERFKIMRGCAIA